MSLNSDTRGTGSAGAGASVHLQAPRLHSGGLGYSAWQINMDVFLQRAGAEGIHRTPMLEEEWTRITRLVEQWAASALSKALALVMADGTATSSSSVQSTATSLNAEQKEARQLVSALVERSRKVFGTLLDRKSVV